MMTKIFCLPVALMLIILGCDDGSNKTDIANFENTHELCHDGLDNDGDSAADCDDIECNSFCQDTEEVFEPDTEDTWHNKPNRGEVIDPGTYVVDEKKTGSFGLVSGNTAVPIIVSSEDYEGVIRVAEDLKTDIEKVTGKTPSVHKDKLPSTSQAVIIGTVGKSPLIDEMIK